MHPFPDNPDTRNRLANKGLRFKQLLRSWLPATLKNHPTLWAVMVIIVALELFNFITTNFSLKNLLGELRFAGLHWADLLAIAFWGMDFAGLNHFFGLPNRNRFTLEQSYLLAAWFVGSALNATMTWWAVSLAMLPTVQGNELVARETLLAYVPILVALLVWLARLLVIGGFRLSLVRINTRQEAETTSQPVPYAETVRSAWVNHPQAVSTAPANTSTSPFNSAPAPTTATASPAPVPPTSFSEAPRSAPLPTRSVAPPPQQPAVNRSTPLSTRSLPNNTRRYPSQPTAQPKRSAFEPSIPAVPELSYESIEELESVPQLLNGHNKNGYQR
jgi:hypothetical protein